MKRILRMPGTKGKVPRDNKKRNDVFTLHSFRTTPRSVLLIAIITRDKREKRDKKERVARDEHKEGYEQRKKEEERRKRKKRAKKWVKNVKQSPSIATSFIVDFWL